MQARYVMPSIISNLKPSKGDRYLGLISDHLINACDALSVHIAFLLTIKLVPGSVPHDMKISTVIPIPKNRHANLLSSCNYRGIALSSVVGKFCS
jgi:hypothetical protein